MKRHSFKVSPFCKKYYFLLGDVAIPLLLAPMYSVLIENNNGYRSRTATLWTEDAPILAKFWILRCRFFSKNLFIIVLLSHVQRFNNLQNIFHVKKLLQSYISPYNSIKQNKNFISIHFHKMLYTARKIFLFCFQKYRSFLSDHIALGATAHGNWGRKGRKGKKLILNEEEVEG